jgi:signal recognition particle receptor subunit beta
MTIHELKQRIEKWLDEAIPFLKKMELPAIASSLVEKFQQTFKDQRIKIILCGEFKNGKTSLINALISKPDLLPTDVLPCTSYITIIEYASELRFEVCRSGSVSPLSLEEFQQLTALKEQDHSIEWIRVGCPSQWLAEDIVLVDTPGLEDLSQTRSDITLKYLPESDVIVLVVTASAPIKATEKNFIRQHITCREIQKVICALNKVDNLNETSEIERVLKYARSKLSKELPDATWIPVSTAKGIESDGNIPELRDAMIKIALHEKTGIIASRFARPAQQLLFEVEARIKTEEAGIGGTLVDLERLVTEFRKKVAETSRSNMKVFAHAQAEIESDVNQWLGTIDERLTSFIEGIEIKVNSLDDLDAVRKFILSKELDRHVAAEMKEISVEFADTMQKTIERVAQDIFSEGLYIPQTPDINTKDMFPSVESFFTRIPDWSWKIIEIILLDIITPGGGLYGQIGAVLERIGLGFLSRGIPLIRKIMPSGIVQDLLVKEILDSVSKLRDNAVPGLRSMTSETTANIFDEIKNALRRQVEAIEAGLENARLQLAGEKTAVAKRRAELAEARIRIAGLRTQVGEFVVSM